MRQGARQGSGLTNGHYYIDSLSVFILFASDLSFLILWSRREAAWLNRTDHASASDWDPLNLYDQYREPARPQPSGALISSSVCCLRITQRWPRLFGQCVKVDNLRGRVWRKALKKVGLEYRPLRQTRHTFATTALSLNENPLWIARVMGHCDTEMVIKVYARYLENNLSSNDVFYWMELIKVWWVNVSNDKQENFRQNWLITAFNELPSQQVTRWNHYGTDERTWTADLLITKTLPPSSHNLQPSATWWNY